MLRKDAEIVTLWPWAARLEAMGQGKYMGFARKKNDGKAVWTGKINIDESMIARPPGMEEIPDDFRELHERPLS